MRTYKIEPVPNSSKEKITYNDNGTIYGPYYHSGLGDIWPGYLNEDRVKWAEMRDALFANDNIITKLMTTAKPNWWSAIQCEILAGMLGHGNQTTLQKLLSDKNGQGVRLLWVSGNPDWTSNERNAINGYFSNNNFNIQIAP